MSSVKLSMNLSFHLMISLPDVHFTWLHIPLMGINEKQIMLGAGKLHVRRPTADGLTAVVGQYKRLRSEPGGFVPHAPWRATRGVSWRVKNRL